MVLGSLGQIPGCSRVKRAQDLGYQTEGNGLHGLGLCFGQVRVSGFRV